MLVRPRVVSQSTGDSLYLEDALEPFLSSAESGAICIFGGLGSGKSSALRYLSGRLPKTPIVELLDEPTRERVAESADRMVVIYSAMEPLDVPHLATFWLGPWGEDEALEYLLAFHKDRCASVMQRLRRRVVETPELLTIVLDRMAADESITDVEAALRRHLDHRIPPRFRRQAAALCFRRTVQPEAPGKDEVSLWGYRGILGFLLGFGISREDIRLLRNPSVRLMLAAERLAGHGQETVFHGGLSTNLSPELIRKAGALVAGRPGVVAALESFIRTRVVCQPMGVSLLHAADPTWRPPDEGPFCWFWGAHLSGVQWPRLKLPDGQFTKANLSRADLRESMLNNGTFKEANLRGAVLRGASLPLVTADDATLAGADLSHTLASGTSFVGANLAGANLTSALLVGALFHGSDLRGANFTRANLKRTLFRADLDGHGMSELLQRVWSKGYKSIGPLAALLPRSREQTQIGDADFTGADFEGAFLQKLDLRDAVLEGARFREARLEESNLEGVRIPGARFEDARLNKTLLTGSFMPGASFRGADLRDAKLADVEWEKSDLRDADLRRATFHMGSSRSGLVFGEPSEGTRSGFYTDEYFDQSYRSPEEIRSASLRGADLRGAIVLGTDFYLVDLREAIFTPDQEEWFRRCGAILETRV